MLRDIARSVVEQEGLVAVIVALEVLEVFVLREAHTKRERPGVDDEAEAMKHLELGEARVVAARCLLGGETL